VSLSLRAMPKRADMIYIDECWSAVPEGSVPLQNMQTFACTPFNATQASNILTRLPASLMPRQMFEIRNGTATTA
jgi:hypothetical protein